MRMTGITLNNYRQFEDVRINLRSNKTKRDLTLIVGRPGSGKTNLLDAINWCFTGKEFYQNNELNDIITNLTCIGKESPIKVNVQINLEDSKREKYHIQRSRTYIEEDGKIVQDGKDEENATLQNCQIPDISVYSFEHIYHLFWQAIRSNSFIFDIHENEKNTFNKLLNEMFLNTVWKDYDSIKWDGKAISVMYNSNDVTNMLPGGEKDLLLLCALISHHIVSENNFPLMIDSAFGRIETGYIPAIINGIMEHCKNKQVILLESNIIPEVNEEEVIYL